MSPNVGNFVHDLVEMAKAMEELPKVQDALNDANGRADALAETVAQRELSILGLKAEIETLNHRLNAAEVARDDAEYRFLELDEKAAGAVNLVRAMQATLGQVTEKLDPPKPQPASEPKVEEVQAQPEATTAWPPANPTSAPAATTSTGAPTVAAGNVEGQQASEGQSEPLPIATSQASGTSPLGAASSETATMQESASITDPTGPYTNKFYYDIPNYVPLSEWLAGGGTEKNYHANRPRQNFA